MEEVNQQLEQQSEQGIESNQEKNVSNEPVAGVRYFEEEHIIKSLENYRNASEEEKIVHCATQMMLSVIAKAPKPLTGEEQSLMFERTVRQVRSERANLFHQLDEAEKELSQLKWHNILPQSLTQQNTVRTGNRHFRSQRSAGGFRGLFIITFGNFVLAHGGKWIYCPTQDQMLKLVNRFQQKKYCENYANSLREKYRSKVVGDKEEENPEFISFKKDLLDQINELRVTV